MSEPIKPVVTHSAHWLDIIRQYPAPGDGIATKYERRYPKWWYRARRRCRNAPPQWMRAMWHRRDRRREEAHLRAADVDAYTPVNPRPRAGNLCDWY